MTAFPYATLPQLSEFALPVYASREVAEQARTLARRFTQAYHFLTSIFDIAPLVRLAVLTRADWPRYTQSPLYGVTFYDYPHRTVVTGGEPAEFWQPLCDLMRTHTPATFQTLCTRYPSATGGLDLTSYVNLFPIHDLGHACHLHMDYWFPRKWLMEFFATLCLHSYLAVREPEQLSLTQSVALAIRQLPVQLFAHRTLPEFEALYIHMPIENYLWYSAHFSQQTDNVYGRMGGEALRRFWQRFVLANVQNLSDEELTSFLTSSFPEVAPILLASP